MGRRTKIIIAIVLALFVLLALFAVGSRRLFMGSFLNLENSAMQTEIARARESIQYELEQIDTIASDYSGWDEAYRFVQDGNRAFIKSNLAKAAFSKLKLNLVAYFDSHGTMVFSRLYDYHNDRELPLPSDIMSHLAPGSPLIHHPDIDSSASGFLKTSSGILMTVSRPVLNSDFKGPAAGTLVMGRFLDAANLSVIATRTKRSLSIWPADAPGQSPDVQAADSSLKKPDDTRIVTKDDIILGFSRFQDIYGKQGFLLKIDSPRSIFVQGQKAVNRFFVLFAVVILLSGAGLYLIFERLTSSLRKQRESETRYHTLVDRAAEGIVIATTDGYFILNANAAFSALTGVSLQEMRGCSLLDFFKGEKSELLEEFSRLLYQTRELRLHHRSGSTLFTEVNACSITHDDQPVLSFIVHNITERKNFEDQLMFQANHDPLTGLPNRILLNDRLSRSIATAQRRNDSLVLMLLDLDHFKVVNDTLGHSYGDQLLISVSLRLQELVRASDTIARIGGDEFVVVLTSVRHKDDVIYVARRFLEVLSTPFNLDGQELHLSASIGIAEYPHDGDTSDELFKKADTAMYQVKENGRNGIQFFSDEMNIRTRRRLLIEAQLRHAIERNELSLDYQPQIELASGKIVGMEALLRWTNSELGPVSPSEFIPVAEETGLIVPLGRWALDTACKQYRQWMEQGLPRLRMAVNLSPRQFGQKDLVEMVREIIHESGIEPSLLDLEVTESLMMNNIDDSIEKMAALKQLGISLSIDDFGTGYSSLNCLQRFPLDILKVDRSFVMEIGNGGKAVVIRAIVAMAHSLGLTVVAEGVETVEQLNFLRNHRCEEVQGYYFSRPLSADNFSELIVLTTDYQLPSCEAAVVSDFPP